MVLDDSDSSSDSESSDSDHVYVIPQRRVRHDTVQNSTQSVIQGRANNCEKSTFYSPADTCTPSSLNRNVSFGSTYVRPRKQIKPPDSYGDWISHQITSEVYYV